MARRRELPPPPPGEWPPHLHPCYVDDWCDPDDLAVHRLVADHVLPPSLTSEERRTAILEDETMAMAAVARTHCFKARLEWADRNGLDWRRLPSIGAPRWRRAGGV